MALCFGVFGGLFSSALLWRPDSKKPTVTEIERRQVLVTGTILEAKVAEKPKPNRRLVLVRQAGYQNELSSSLIPPSPPITFFTELLDATGYEKHSLRKPGLTACAETRTKAIKLVILNIVDMKTIRFLEGLNERSPNLLVLILFSPDENITVEEARFRGARHFAKPFTEQEFQQAVGTRASQPRPDDSKSAELVSQGATS